MQVTDTAQFQIDKLYPAPQQTFFSQKNNGGVGMSSSIFAAKKFTIIFTGDNHSYLDPSKNIKLSNESSQLGGVIRRANYISEFLKKETGIILDAGDFLSGTPYFDYYKGISDIEMMNRIPYQIVTIGNHDLDKGWEHLKELLKKASFSVVCANIFETCSQKPILPAYQIITIEGAKVAIVGILGREAWSSIRPSSRKGLVLIDPDEVLNELLTLLRPHVDVLVLLSHSGIVSDKLFAEKHLLLDLILGGHSHTYMEQAQKVITDGKIIPVFHAYKYGQVLGQVRIEVSESSLDITTSTVVMDEKWNFKQPENKSLLEIEMLLSSYALEIQKKYSNMIGNCVKVLPKEDMSTQLTPLGIQLCEIFRQATNVDLAFLPSNGIRRGFEIGPITPTNLIEIIPFVEPLWIIKGKGSWIRQLMENGLKRWPTGQRTFQYSGILLEFTENDKISIKVGKNLLDDNEFYSIVSCSFFFEREIKDDEGKLKIELLSVIDKEIQEHFESTHETLIKWIQKFGVGEWVESV